MTKAATIVRAGAPRDVSWDDRQRGRLVPRPASTPTPRRPRTSWWGRFASTPAGDHEAPHHHDVAETVYVPSGGGTAHCRGRDIRLDPGDTMSVPAGVVHSWRAGEDGLAMLYVFPVDRFAEVQYHWAEHG